MVDLLLVAEHSRYWLGPFCRLPQIHGEIVACLDKPLDDFSLDRRGF